MSGDRREACLARVSLVPATRTTESRPILLSAAPVPDPKAPKNRILLAGDVPIPINPPPGCTFHPRCRERRDICRSEKPAFREISAGRFVACHTR